MRASVHILLGTRLHKGHTDLARTDKDTTWRRDIQRCTLSYLQADTVYEVDTPKGIHSFTDANKDTVFRT